MVTIRSFGVGLALTAALAAINAWLTVQLRVNFFGGVQMPFGAIFVLQALLLFYNIPLRLLQTAMPYLRRVPVIGRLCAPFEAVELLVIYVMMIFGALLSTPGTDNFFLTTGSGLFYFSTRENRWAETFYDFIPPHFAPGWNGHVFQREVIDKLYLGGLSFNQVPWHAWTAMLLGWGILLLLLYATLFFISLVLRRQWIEAEALSFPLLQLPLQMVEAGPGNTPPGAFWTNRTLWAGTALAGGIHLLRGLNAYFPDWPVISTFQGNSYQIGLTEMPWSTMGATSIEFFLGVIGIAFLLTRELSFSFWFFFLAFKLQHVAATLIGYPANTLPHDTNLGNPAFITWQSVGAWVMMALLLLWSAREPVGHFLRGFSSGSRKVLADEPFSPSFVLGGLLLSLGGFFFWCWFAGINLAAAGAFLALYILMSIVIARLVVEGGFLYPQITFAPIEALTGSGLTAQVMGPASLTKLSFMQPMLFFDMRTNLLPVFMHAMKLANTLGMERRQVRRFMLCAAAAAVVALVVSTVMTLATLYRVGGLASNNWFVQHGPQRVFRGTADLLAAPSERPFGNWAWMAVGAGVVWLLTFARARFLWFPFHPLAYLVASGSPISKMWASFFVGWAVKSLLLKFGGQETTMRARPFMIGLILGNAISMVLWTIYGIFAGTQIPYWPG
jgi:hypothetical protein